MSQEHAEETQYWTIILCNHDPIKNAKTYLYLRTSNRLDHFGSSFNVTIMVFYYGNLSNTKCLLMCTLNDSPNKLLVDQIEQEQWRCGQIQSLNFMISLKNI